MALIFLQPPLGYRKPNLDDNASVTMTASQLAGFSSITASGTNSFLKSASLDATAVIANTAIETYVLGSNYTGMTVSGNVNVTGSNNNNTIKIATGTYTGTITDNHTLDAIPSSLVITLIFLQPSLAISNTY